MMAAQTRRPFHQIPENVKTTFFRVTYMLLYTHTQVEKGGVASSGGAK